MNLQQLRIVRETVRRDFNLTEVANALYTSQPGVSKHIKDLEDEIGVELFIRRGKRLTGMTEPGKELVAVVERIVLDTHNIKVIANQFATRDHGNLVLATTHTQARYALPEVIKAFKAEYPNVHLVLQQGSPREIADLLAAGDADIAVATESLDRVAGVATFPCYSWHHGIVVPQGHPLTAIEQPSLEQIAAYPLITYHHGFTGRALIDNAFAAAGIAPDVVLAAIDADVIKTYVDVGMGVGIIASVAYNPLRDDHLVLIDGAHLFPQSTTRIALRIGKYLRDYAYRFVGMLAPHLSPAELKAAVHGAADD